MQLHLLHLDDALIRQRNFMARCHEVGALETEALVPGNAMRLWAEQPVLTAFEQFLKVRMGLGRGTPVTFFGSGDFHHVTGMLLPVILEHADAPVTVIHFDNHPDWVSHDDGMHCGSWVNRALALPKVDRVITIGVCSKDLTLPECKGANLEALKEGKIILYPFAHAPSRVLGSYGTGASYQQQGRQLYWRTMEQMDPEEMLSELLAHIRTSRIYITVDKDVLVRADAVTNWDQGKMQLGGLIALISGLAAQRGIAGIDVTGDYSTPQYSGTPWIRLKKRTEAAIDQPRGVVDLQEAATCNAKTNSALLTLFQEILA
jgi:hypothetical protein